LKSDNRHGKGLITCLIPERIMPNRKAKQRKRTKMLKRKSIAEYKSKKRRERKDARKINAII